MRRWLDNLVGLIVVFSILGCLSWWYYIEYDAASRDSIIWHELAHLEINEKYGIPSNYTIINYGWGNYGGTTFSAYRTNETRILHSMNEIVGYNLNSVTERLDVVSHLMAFSVFIQICLLLILAGKRR